MANPSSALTVAPGLHAIGIQTDGRDMMIAHLTRTKHEIRINSVQRLSLSAGFDVPSGGGGSSSSVDLSPFGSDLESSVAGMVGTGEAVEDDTHLLSSALLRMPMAKCRIGIGIAPANVRFFNAGEALPNEKPSSLVERIRAEAQSKIGETVTQANSHVEIQSIGPAWCIVHRDELQIVDKLEELKSHIGNPRMRYTLIDPVEVSLVGLVNREWPTDANVITVLIHIGKEYTHLILMRDGEVVTVAPLIPTGNASPALLQTLASKILLEQDEVGISEIHRIGLSGNVISLNAKEFFETRYPNINVRILTNGGCNDETLTDEERSILPEFTVAIGLALKILDPTGFWKSNLLPETIKRRQRVMSFGWHGIVLMLLLFVSTMVVTFMSVKEKQHAHQLKTTLIVKQQQNQANILMRAELDSLMVNMASVQQLVHISDSLSVGWHRWSDFMQELDGKGRLVKSVWLESIQSGKDGVTFLGKSLYLSRINEIARIYPNTIINSVNRIEIQNRTVFKFELKIPYAPDENLAGDGLPTTPGKPGAKPAAAPAQGGKAPPAPASGSKTQANPTANGGVS